MLSTQPAAVTIAPAVKPFQYAAHHRLNHDYSPFHQNLDVALKCFYSKANLSTVLLKKELLSYSNLYLLDYATLDVWPSVVFIKLPKWLPCKDSGLFEKAPQYFCRFISKRDFLEAVFEYAMLQGHQLDVICDRSQQFTVNSAKTGEPHTLTPTTHRCDCSCKAYRNLNIAFAEEPKMAALLVEHPILAGQVPDKHIFALWKMWGASDQASYVVERKRREQHEKQKELLRNFGLGLRQDIPGHLDVWCQRKKIGTVDQRFDLEGNSWWINQRQVSLYTFVPGDHIHYGTSEEAAIALAKLTQAISEGETAKADLFGGGWDTPIERSVETQAAPQLVTASANKKVTNDPFGGFDF